MTRSAPPGRRALRRSVLGAGLLAVMAVVGSPRTSHAETVRAITVHHDGADGPHVAPLTRFGTLGEPLAYIDWLCVGVGNDLGPTMTVRLADLDVTNERGERLGTFVSKSGNEHELRAFHVRPSAGRAEVLRYCTRIRPRDDSEGSVRFVADDTRTKRLEKVVFGLRGDRRGCIDTNGRPGDCGALDPSRATFTWGASATSFSSIALGYARARDLTGNDIGSQARVLLQMPLLVVSAGSTRHFALELDAGFSIPIVLAASDARPGFGLGAFWSQCIVARFVVVPRVCLGASIDAMIDGRVSGARIDDPAARPVASWFVSIGFGVR